MWHFFIGSKIFLIELFFPKKISRENCQPIIVTWTELWIGWIVRCLNWNHCKAEAQTKILNVQVGLDLNPNTDTDIRSSKQTQIVTLLLFRKSYWVEPVFRSQNLIIIQFSNGVCVYYLVKRVLQTSNHCSLFSS